LIRYTYDKKRGGEYMTMGRFRKLAALGMVLCIVGAAVLAAPVTTQAAYYDFAPLGIDALDKDQEE